MQKEIKELAEMLGHQESDEKETDRNARDSITHIESKFHPKPSFRGNIVGFSYSGDIGKVVEITPNYLRKEDGYKIQESEIVGIVRTKINKIGYPTVWLSEMR